MNPDLPAIIDDWPLRWREAFIERAAIMEYDGMLPRPVAEERAEEMVRQEHQRQEG